jgi:hypothetical protein
MLESGHIEVQLPRVLQQVLPLDFRLILKKLVVVFPELPLVISGDGRDGRQRRVLMKVERKMFPDDPDVVAVGLADLIEGRTDPRAERSLKVGELGDRYRSG